MRGLQLNTLKMYGEAYLKGDFGEMSRSDWRKQAEKIIFDMLERNYVFGHLYPEDVSYNWRKDDSLLYITAKYSNGYDLTISLRGDMAVVNNIYISY